MVVEVETSILAYMKLNPFEFGDLPLIDFHLYYNKVINMYEELSDGGDTNLTKQLTGLI